MKKTFHGNETTGGQGKEKAALTCQEITHGRRKERKQEVT